MSDCTNGGRNVHRRPHDTLRMRMEFEGGERPWMYALAMNGRKVGALFLDGERYVPERTGELKIAKSGPMYTVYRFTCCGYEHAESNTDAGATDIPGTACPKCGARIE